jgi:DGQHR domain-containing protein
VEFLSSYDLRLPALEIRQSDTRRLYTFAVDGKLLPQFAAVSRIHRNDRSDVEGYQRPEVLSHIRAIQRYLESKDPLIPNALVVAFDSRVRFEPTVRGEFEHSRTGNIVIPLDDTRPEDEHPGWIVDGQQRSAAIRQAKITSFPICVTAFITDNEVEQRTQFILVNSTKPLPKGLIYELLPVTEGELPTLLQARRFPAHLLQRLNFDEDSPLRGMIRTPTTPSGVIKDNSLMKAMENSLSDGALYRYRDPMTGTGDVDTMLRLLKQFWAAVADVWSDGWNLPPRRSRLLHGAGVVTLGFLMDAIADRHWDIAVPDALTFRDQLTPLREICRWTNGYWDFGPQDKRKWNELQNTSKDIQVLTNYLLSEYKMRVWSQPRPLSNASSSG